MVRHPFFANTNRAFIFLSLLISLNSVVYSITFTSNTVIAHNNNSFDGQDVIVDGCVLTIDGEHSFGNLSVINNGMLRHSPAPNGEVENNVNINVDGNVLIDETSSINASGLGYSSNLGPGAGSVFSGASGGGGGYGGDGGTGYTRYNINYPAGSYTYGYPAGGDSYGDVNEPTDFGSGGGGPHGNGGSGGGSIRLIVEGTLYLDGSILTNGGNGHSSVQYRKTSGGGGSGGSVWITAGIVDGSGVISANGGNGNSFHESHYRDYKSGGGGGGRIALYYDSKTYSGSISALGGSSSYQDGGAGTIEIFGPPEQDDNGPIQPTYPSITTDLIGYENIVFITHGWNGALASADHSWIDEMANDFNLYFSTNAMSSWKAVSYNWQEHAGGIGLSMLTAKENAGIIGNYIAPQIASLPNCSHLHLIAHSAGVWMIDEISKVIDSSRPDITIHITFLDSYTPWGTVGVDSLGAYADWAEHYVDQRNETDLLPDGVNVGLRGTVTSSTLEKAYNIDITGDDPIFYKTGPEAHRWPCVWYDGTITETIPTLRNWGFASSLESGAIPGLEEMQQAFPRGGRENYPPESESPQPIDHVREMAYNPTYWGTYVPNYSSPDDVQYTGTQLVINSGEFSQPLQTLSMSLTADSQTTGSAPTDTSWFSVVIDANEPANALSFESQFTSQTGSQSILEIYWEDQIIGSIDERYVFDGMQSYEYILPELYGPGSYKLAFKLATYNDSASSIEIDNLKLKLYRTSYDLYADNEINLLDFAVMAKEWSMQKRPEDLAPEGGDGIVNLLDFAIFADSWGQDPGQDIERLKNISENWLITYELPISDINHSGSVGIEDFLIMAEHWLDVPSGEGTVTILDQVSDIDLTGNIIYAINCGQGLREGDPLANPYLTGDGNNWGSSYHGQDLDVGGVTFLCDMWSTVDEARVYNKVSHDGVTDFDVFGATDDWRFLPERGANNTGNDDGGIVGLANYVSGWKSENAKWQSPYEGKHDSDVSGLFVGDVSQDAINLRAILGRTGAQNVGTYNSAYGCGERDMTFDFDVEAGNQYKVQILFYKNTGEHTGMRIAFDQPDNIFFDDLDLEVECTSTAGLIYSYTFTAADEVFNIYIGRRTDNYNPGSGVWDIGNVNAITLEKL